VEPKANSPTVAPAAPVAEAVMKLPIQILTKADVSRLVREMDSLEMFFTAAALRAADAKTVPQVSQQLTVLLNENNLNLLTKEDRLKIRNFLKYLHGNAPVVHASFAADPKPDFLMKIVAWFREQAHPNVLLQIGLQPGLAAGCIFRTTNKYFDFSFKKHFETDKAKLILGLKGQVEAK
jgi:F0F1-type ATP synthase delta subunit